MLVISEWFAIDLVACWIKNCELYDLKEDFQLFEMLLLPCYRISGPPFLSCVIQQSEQSNGKCTSFSMQR